MCEGLFYFGNGWAPEIGILIDWTFERDYSNGGKIVCRRIDIAGWYIWQNTVSNCKYFLKYHLTSRDRFFLIFLREPTSKVNAMRKKCRKWNKQVGDRRVKVGVCVCRLLELDEKCSIRVHFRFVHRIESSLPWHTFSRAKMLMSGINLATSIDPHIHQKKRNCSSSLFSLSLSPSQLLVRWATFSGLGNSEYHYEHYVYTTKL